MRCLLILFLILGTGGCVSLTPTPSPVESDTTEDIQGTAISAQKQPLTDIDYVYIGMSYEEVMRIMEDKVIIGYRKTDSVLEDYEEIYTENPQRKEILRDKDTIYEIFYFFTEIQKPDGLIAEDELTPLVFQNNKLIGKTTNFLFGLKKKLNK